jgi:hypothetical protein
MYEWGGRRGWMSGTRRRGVYEWDQEEGVYEWDQEEGRWRGCTHTPAAAQSSGLKSHFESYYKERDREEEEREEILAENQYLIFRITPGPGGPSLHPPPPLPFLPYSTPPPPLPRYCTSYCKTRTLLLRMEHLSFKFTKSCHLQRSSC